MMLHIDLSPDDIILLAAEDIQRKRRVEAGIEAARRWIAEGYPYPDRAIPAAIAQCEIERLISGCNPN